MRVALVRRRECVPKTLGSSPMAPIHCPTKQAYCRVVRHGYAGYAPETRIRRVACRHSLDARVGFPRVSAVPQLPVLGGGSRCFTQSRRWHCAAIPVRDRETSDAVLPTVRAVKRDLLRCSIQPLARSRNHRIDRHSNQDRVEEKRYHRMPGHCSPHRCGEDVRI